MIAPNGQLASMVRDHAVKAGTTAAPSRCRPKGLFLMEEKTLETVYGPAEMQAVTELLDVEPVTFDRTTIGANMERLKDVEIIMGSWGAPVMDEIFMEAAPNLKALFYAAGSVRPFTTPAFWAQNPTVSSAYAINAKPVAEYALGVILLSLKRFWAFTQSVRAETDPWADHNRVVPGAYGSTVGLLSCGMIARRLIHLLKPFEVRCLVYDPFVNEKEMSDIGAELCSLQDIFEQSDVVSIHTPLLPETRGLVRGRLIEAMKPGATLINTARGGLIHELEFMEAMSRRQDLTAVLDVLDVEPPLRGTTLLQIPNVWVTPHIAGSLGPECRRLGGAMADELGRYLSGKPLLWQITQDFATRMA